MKMKEITVGAWGHYPMENDEALAWVNVVIEQPLARAISRVLRSFVESRRPTALKKLEVEAAVSLLFFFTGELDKQFCGIDLREQARQEGLWQLADLALERLSSDQKWLLDWGEPESKKAIWSQMREALRSNERSNSTNQG